MSAKLLAAIGAILAEADASTGVDAADPSAAFPISREAIAQLRDACAMTPERRDFWEDVLTTLLESDAIAYWVALADRIERHPQSAGARRYSVKRFRIREDETRKRFDLTPEALEIGAARLASPAFQINAAMRGTILGAVASLDAGEIDSSAADCIAQAACFGELVYG